MKVRCNLNIPGNGNLEIGKTYVVYGILMKSGVLSYLLYTSVAPRWFLATRFDIIDKLLPLKWYFRFNKEKNIATWSYKEFVFDAEHHEGLVECKKEDIEIFMKRKEEIDEYEELRKIKQKKVG